MKLSPQSAPSAQTGKAKAAPKDRSGPLTAATLEKLVLAKLDDDKAEDVVSIDLTDKSSMADRMIVASGRSHRHVGALADHLLRALKDAGFGRARVEGMPHNDWVLIDAGDLIVHLFRPEVRQFYNIEKIWAVDSRHRTADAS
ncbi:MAG: ribosome silencing factor [Alphaproteobacteria bacterium]